MICFVLFRVDGVFCVGQSLVWAALGASAPSLSGRLCVALVWALGVASVRVPPARVSTVAPCFAHAYVAQRWVVSSTPNSSHVILFKRRRRVNASVINTLVQLSSRLEPCILRLVSAKGTSFRP